MAAAKKSRRRELMDRVNDPEQLDKTPIELPMDAKAHGKSIQEQIQEQIAIQLAKKIRGG